MGSSAVEWDRAVGPRATSKSSQAGGSCLAGWARLRDSREVTGEAMAGPESSECLLAGPHCTSQVRTKSVLSTAAGFLQTEQGGSHACLVTSSLTLPPLWNRSQQQPIAESGPRREQDGTRWPAAAWDGTRWPGGCLGVGISESCLCTRYGRGENASTRPLGSGFVSGWVVCGKIPEGQVGLWMDSWALREKRGWPQPHTDVQWALTRGPARFWGLRMTLGIRADPCPLPPRCPTVGRKDAVERRGHGDSSQGKQCGH